MKKLSFANRLFALLLALVMVVGLAPVINLTEVFAAEEEPIVIIAGSDFQNEDGDAAGAAQVKELLNAIKADGYSKADGFLFAGDYNYPSVTSTSLSISGKKALQKAVQSVYGTNMNEIYIQGNHDPDSLVANGTLAPSGDNDTDNYGVFVINEKDYDWGGDDPVATEDISYELSDYLDEKVAEGYSKPIFVVSHIPLHYSMRTYIDDDGDATYAYMIFDELNEAGAAGLNIIFLFGHDHSGGWDDYLGGSSVFLAKGDKINICQGNQKEFEVETLNFTYMNAGYVTYYRNLNPGAETDLTMTVFEITGDKVVIKRYSAEGLHDLKSKGVRNSYHGEYQYRPNTKVYVSPQVISLVKKADTTALEAAIALAEEMKDTDYTQESYTVLQNALDAAKTVLAKSNPTQEEVDSALKTLNDALSALKEYVPETNKNVLSKAISDAEAVDAQKYTDDSYAALTDALETAKAVMQNANATQAEADSAAAALQAAIKALKERPATTDPTDPTETPTDPTETPTDPTEEPTNPIDPTEDPTDPTEAPTNPTDPTVAPADPTDAPTEAPTNAPAADKDAEPKGDSTVLIVVIIAAVLVAAGVAVIVIKKKRG